MHEYTWCTSNVLRCTSCTTSVAGTHPKPALRYT